MDAIHSSTLQFSVYKWLGSLFYVYGITPHYILSIWDYGKWYTMKLLYMFATGLELKLPSQTRCAVCQLEFAVPIVQWYWRGAIVPSYYYHAAAIYAISKSCCVCLHLKLTVAVESEMKLYALTIVYVYKKKLFWATLCDGA